MGRPLRIEYPGALYHIVSRGNERSDIFRDDADRLMFLDILKDYHERFGILIHCYVLMDNHYHLVVETPQANLLKVMHGLNSGYTGYFNRKYNRSGHLFQGRYKAIVIDKESYLIELSRYIHLNPVRAGMVEHPEQYAWSSYKGYLLKRNSSDWVDYSWILGALGNSNQRRLYKEYVSSETPESQMRKLYGRIILGSDEFISSLKKVLPKDSGEGILKKRLLNSDSDPHTILKITAEEFGMTPDELKTKGVHRDTAIYLVRRYSGLGNRGTGELFGGMHYTAVSRLCTSFSKEQEKDRKLKSRVENILSRLKA
ncbi:MAG TPA: transposase [Desulfomonilia bacterium]